MSFREAALRRTHLTPSLYEGERPRFEQRYARTEGDDVATLGLHEASVCLGGSRWSVSVTDAVC